MIGNIFRIFMVFGILVANFGILIPMVLNLPYDAAVYLGYVWGAVSPFIAFSAMSKEWNEIQFRLEAKENKRKLLEKGEL